MKQFLAMRRRNVRRRDGVEETKKRKQRGGQVPIPEEIAGDKSDAETDDGLA